MNDNYSLLRSIIHSILCRITWEKFVRSCIFSMRTFNCLKEQNQQVFAKNALVLCGIYTTELPCHIFKHGLLLALNCVLIWYSPPVSCSIWYSIYLFFYIWISFSITKFWSILVYATAMSYWLIWLPYSLKWFPKMILSACVLLHMIYNIPIFLHLNLLLLL